MTATTPILVCCYRLKSGPTRLCATASRRPSVNRLVQLVIGGETDPTNLVLVVKSDTISVTPTNGFTETGATNLTIVGCAECANAVVEVQVRGLDAPLARLHVMVLPWVTNSIGIYRVEDGASEKTAPVDGPSSATIIASLNSVYTQACVHFALANPQHADSVTNMEFDTYLKPHRTPGMLQAIAKNGALEYDELPAAISNNSWEGHCRIFLFKNSGCRSWNEFERKKWAGFAPLGGRWGVAFTTDPALSAMTIPHEIGHGLNLSTRDAQTNHDLGPAPNGTWPLMYPSTDDSNRWIRHQDWWKANETAYERAHQTP